MLFKNANDYYRHIGIQFFAEPEDGQQDSQDPQETPNEPTGEQAPGQTSEGNKNSGAAVERPTFDDLLKDGYQAEFDRRVTKALNTARSRWEQGAAEAATEAEKLARMSETQKAQYMLDKDRKALESEKAQFQHQQMEVQTGAQLQSMGYDASFAKFVTGKDAEATNENLTAFDTLMRAYRAGVVNSQMRGTPPRQPEHSDSGVSRDAVKSMTPAQIMEAFSKGDLDNLLKGDS